MRTQNDLPAHTVGFLTAGAGVTLTQVQTVLGILAASVGLALSVATFIWRRRENRLREEMLRRQIEGLEDDE